ncbi:MAG: hypothetical protein E5V49_03720 [Mesorhizobium sp.]|nr:hypothetical protein EN848_12315 [bacterium M00.F.Ca.ET.205.01.1.1]TGU55970.1 hypothetical protein EN795_00710 [bacterium M00.F.Ca.ET.152.01.1.1]TGV40608.1 hypothetical protein EN829_003730 [Mesorhizobium sp. M00.F.Ca.ET.186.01.1.1]TGZ45587.1 hypothetical protein EN805_03710 [bacterium M00.F.Ca.ET.162.01.1.1]TJW34493.1 MAG: hypothetical protein E5V49_03720 [Mesorhizobium sp.]
MPSSIRAKADRRFARLRLDPFYPSLHFKQVGRYWSARVDENYRAVAIRDNDDVIWFWIGTHSDYDHLLK